MAKAKQGHLKGMKPPSIPEIDAAAEVYFDFMMERCKLSTKEKESNAELLDVMKKHKLQFYKMPDGKVVSIVGTTKARVVAPKDKAESNGEAE